MKNLFIFLVLSLMNSTSINGQELYFPPAIGIWQTINTQDLDWCDEELDDLHDFLEEKDTKAFIILKDGHLAVEWYYGSFTQDSLWYWASAGKSLTATLVGIAQEEGLLSIDDPAQDYLGAGWTNTSAEQEAQITIRHQLTMTSGLNDVIFACTNPICLNFTADVGTRWAYHNAPYTLLDGVIEAASGQSLNSYYLSKIGSKIGAFGSYFPIGFNNVFFSNARAMARFGLLIQADGIWNETTVLGDMDYLTAMTSPSQELNPSYGYLWWLNGQSSYLLPTMQTVFNGPIIETAPDDLFAALGKDDQKIYIVPSEGLVVIRMGEAASESLALSEFDADLWQKILNLNCTTTLDPILNEPSSLVLSPNPVKNDLSIIFNEPIEHLFVYNSTGALIIQTEGDHIQLLNLSSGVYYLKIVTSDHQLYFRKFVKQ